MIKARPCRLHVREAGRLARNRRPIVLLHGWSCHGGFFGPQLSRLAAETLLLAPDLPGHGRTGGKVPLSIESAADEVAALLEQRQLDDVVLLGWSMGAHVALSLIDLHGSERIAALMVEDMTPKVLNDADWRLGTSDGTDAARNREVLASIEPYWTHYAPRIASRIFATGRQAAHEVLDYATREIAAADPAMLKPMWASLTAQDFRGLLPRLTIPVHLAMGRHSALYGEEVAAWQMQALRHGSLHVFERSGHAPHMEEPGEFSALLLDMATIR